ncbi:MAG: porin [Salinisphaera sp.]|uniref:porin n=1 Tax=Salinisphaera sp. TaxID=1914330 RepID=UPI003C7B4098
MRSINKYVLPSAVSLVTAMGVAVPAAQAFDFKASGQVDRAVTAVDNGHRSDIGFVDNTGSNTRFRFTGDQVMDNGMKVGFDYEIAIGNNASADWDVKNAGNEQNNFLDNRQANIYLEGNFGRFTLGKVDGAANATSEVDYSGLTYLGGGVDFADYAGGLSFWGKNGQVAAGNPKVGQVFNSFDALSRQNAIRYDSPTFSGVTLSASLDSGHAYELAARYATDLARGGKFGVAADYVDSENQKETFDPNNSLYINGDRFREMGGSASLLLPSGIVFTVSGKHRQFVHSRQNSANNFFGGIGYVSGDNHFQVNYDRTDGAYIDGSKGNQYGLAYRRDWTKSIQMYASYHLYTASGLGQGVKDINQIYTGVRLKFM